MSTAIEVCGLTMSYADRRVLEGVDFEVKTGEVFCLLGPNGAGKTTTVEILEGFRQRTGGTVSVLGMDPRAQSARLRARIGIVLQECGFPRQARVAELIDSWRSYYRNPRDLEDLLKVVELTRDRNVQVRRLSGGQRRRLDLALALAGDPDLIFLDEPTTGFDPEARRSAWDTVRKLRELGKTILLTTHYLDEAQELADRVAIVKDGRILAIGPPRELGVGAAHYRVAWRASDGRLLERQTDDPTALLAELTADALARGERLEELSVGRPTLEDVYLELTAEPEHEQIAGGASDA
ncbi:MAG TPA: ABC transporter ATP-binding protein [Solirubrobacteraceae bacterium]|nr:ABC transporter ATP-binding protein [Solirubrobacteraceae bacterium]